MKRPFNRGAQNELFGFAKENRKSPTEAERVLWNELRNKRLCGYKFRRQHPIDEYILDFYCHSKKLCIELDGEYHHTQEQQSYDLRRTKELNQMHDIKVIRFPNKMVLENLTFVLNEILKELKS